MNKVVINDFAPNAQNRASVPAAGSSDYQSAGELLDVNARDTICYASFEAEGIDLLNSDLVFAESGDNTGYISLGQSNSKREFDAEDGSYIQIFIVMSGGYYSAPGITFHFWQHYCTKIMIDWRDYSTGEYKSSKTFYPDSLNYFCDNYVENFNVIRIRFYATEVPYQFVKLSGIDLGRTREITDFVSNIEIFTEIDTNCADTPGSTCDFVARITDFKPQDMQELYVYGGKDEKLFGKFIINRAPTVGKNIYSFECSDEIVKLQNSAFSEKNQGSYTVAAIADEIKESSNIDIDCGEYADTVLTGFIEKDKTSRLAATMISFASRTFLTGFGSKTLRLKKARELRYKLISASQILGKPEFTNIIPYTKIVLNQYENEFGDPVKSSSKTKWGNVSGINDSLIFDRYSLISDFDKIFDDVVSSCFDRSEITARILYQGEEPGDVCAIETPYDGIKTGIIKNMSVSIGHRITATIKMIERDFSSEGGEG